jgi:hypothetical protein
MRLLTILYVANATLLLLHEIESAYVEEWEILKLPGGIKGFLLMHVPVILLLFWGVLEIEKRTPAGTLIAVIAGLGGLMPFFVHKIAARKPGYFESPASNALIFLNIPAGAATALLAAADLFR